MIRELRNHVRHLKQKYPRTVSLTGQVLLVVLALGVVQWYQTRHLVKEQAPQVYLPALDGKTYSTEPPARRTLLYFFAPWCTVCKLNFDNLERLKNWHSADESRFRLLAIALSYEQASEIREFLQDKKHSFPILLGSDETALAWRIHAFPTFYVLNEKNEVTSSGVGYTTTLGLWWRTW